MKKGLFKKIAICLLGGCMALLTACGGDPDGSNEAKRGLDDYEFTKASYATVDKEGREITPMHKKKTDHDRYVGVFYFMWLGTHETSAGVYDITKLLKTENGLDAVFNKSYGIGDKVPNSVNAELGYPNGMESPNMYVHWTNEPLFGYYNTADDWVITRHMEMLAMADVDFIFLDTTNDFDYAENVNGNYSAVQAASPSDAKVKQLGRPTYTLLDTILKLSEQGWDVPKVVFYTNSRSGTLVDKIYRDFYADGKYDDIWFAPFGKPMIVGTTKNNKGSDMNNAGSEERLVPISDTLCDYFDVRESQWPNHRKDDNGFPWMDWSNGYNEYYPTNKMVNVNVAQHGASENSYSIYTQKHKVADGRSSRGWNEKEETIEENWMAGRNIEDQWDSVWHYEEEGKSVEMVTVTGWNEWLAWKLGSGMSPVRYVDNFSNEFSRDMEPDKNYYQDNFYLQLVRNVRKYKYDTAKSDYKWEQKTIKSVADFSSVKAVYKDFEGDALKRDFFGFDIRPASKENNVLGSWYKDDSNRNDIVETRVTHDDKNVYLLIKTKEDITPYVSGENWMNVLIKTQNSASSNSWESYDYILNRNPATNKTSVERSTGGWNWTKSGEADMLVDGNVMFITVPLSALGMTGGKVAFEFKVADNVTNYTDIMDYYVSGDSAPIGRLRYSYGY